jgi:hypothetical protein
MGTTTSTHALPLVFPDGHKALPTGWTKISAFLVVGYLSMSRSFAYLGLPWISLYVGEISLLAFLLWGPRTKYGSWLRTVRRIRRLGRFEWLLLLLLCYGGVQALRGILAGYPTFAALRDTAFNYYPLFVFLGIWVGVQDKKFLRRTVRALAWWNGCYGLAYVLFLSRLSWTMPGTAKAASSVPVFSEPYGSAVALLGLLAFEPLLRRVWHLLALNALVMLWVQVRAEWVGFAIGLFVFAWCTRQMKRLVVPCLVVILLLGAMYFAKIDLPSPQGRGGRFSVGDVIGRAVAPINKGLASNLSTGNDSVAYSATAEWRVVWWAAIWETLKARTSTMFFGLGYGYPLGDLNPMIEPGTFIQTPHSYFFYALAYTGWAGVVLVVLLQTELLRLLLRSFRVTGQPFGLMCWAALVAASLFEDFFEAPFGAIPFFLLTGMALAPALLRSSGGPPRKTDPSRDRAPSGDLSSPAQCC